MDWDANNSFTKWATEPGIENPDERNVDTQALMVRAMPVIAGVIRARLRFTHSAWWNNEQQRRDAEDIQSDTLLHLLTKLEQLRTHTAEAPIQDFENYAASVAHQVCNQYLRQKYPQRTRLSDQLRYLFTHQPRLQLWADDERVRLCGFQVWQTQRRRAVTAETVRRLCEDPQTFLRTLPARPDWQRLDLADQCARVLQYLNAPLEFADLVTVIARLHQLSEAPPDDSRTTRAQEKEATRDNAASAVEERLYIQCVWQEICRLPLPHRTALLLNLGAATERGLLLALVEQGIVTIRQIATALELTPTAFAELWPHLPLSDQEIAARMDCTRQHIINLRSSARRQLTKRLQK